MRFLLDTHTILWFFSGHQNLNQNVKNLIEDPQNKKLISIASVWEMAIKQSQQRLNLGQSATNYIQEKIKFSDFEVLSIELNHLELISILEFHHRDPFDRLIIAQALSEKIKVLSKDIIFDQYQVDRVWDRLSNETI